MSFFLDFVLQLLPKIFAGDTFSVVLGKIHPRERFSLCHFGFWNQSYTTFSEAALINSFWCSSINHKSIVIMNDILETFDWTISKSDLSMAVRMNFMIVSAEEIRSSARNIYYLFKLILICEKNYLKIYFLCFLFNFEVSRPLIYFLEFPNYYSFLE